MTLRRCFNRHLFLLLAVAIVAGAASPVAAFSAREGHTKVVISKNLMMLPNASAAAEVVQKGGGEIVQEYETQTVAYFLTDTLKGLSDRAAELRVEIRPRDDFDKIFLPEGTIDARRGVEGSLPGLQRSAPYKKGEWGAYILQFAGPIKPEWEKQVESLGVKLVQYIPYNAYIVAGTPEVMRTAEKLPFVQLVDMLHVGLKVHPQPGKEGDIRDFIVQLIDAPGVDAFMDSLGARASSKVTTRRASAGQLDLQASFAARDLPDIVASPLVFCVVEAPILQPSDERVALSLTRNVSGGPEARAPANPGSYKAWLDGICPFCTHLQDDHFWVGVADASGLDDGATNGRHNPALPGPKVRFGTNFDSPGADLVDTSSHGTMIAGIATGDTTNATATDYPGGYFYATGVAPSAGVYVTKISRSSSPTGTFAYAHDAASQPAGQDDVRVQNHSYNQYGSSPCYGGTYSVLSQQFDQSVIDADNGLFNSSIDPIVLTVSAGNQIGQIDRLHHTDPCASTRKFTLPPGTAKNVISVGSAEIPRSSLEQWQCHFCGQNSFENIAANSMRGTLTTGWYKPDLFAPAENIVSTRSQAESYPHDDGAQCRPTPSNSSPLVAGSDYVAGGGTSFAAPVAAGAALLARRFYEEAVNPGCHGSSVSPCIPYSSRPSLTKAMLIAGARSMAGGAEKNLLYAPFAEPEYTVESQPIGVFPNNQQGFGRISLEDVLSPYPFRYFVNEPPSSLLTPTAQWTRTLTVHDATLPVKIALVWSDPPAVLSPGQTTTTPLVNDLDLRVDLGTPCGKRFVGNKLVIENTTQGEVSFDYGCNNANLPADVLNNAEIARFFAPAGTTFTVYVTNASGMANSAQTFALVAYNAYDAASTSLPLGTPVISPLDSTSSTRITFSWSPVSGAPLGYDIRRKSGLNGESTYGTPVHVTATSFDSLTDGGALLTPNTAYVYQVRATRPPFASAWSEPDLATTSAYTHADANHHIVAGSVMAATDIVELRAVVNSVRAAASLPQYVPILPSNPNGSLAGAVIHAEDISQLRAALDAARNSLGLAAAVYTDSQLIHSSTTVKAVHINDLRDGVQ
ncbi:MAG: trimeric autotransporter adhesin [Thermoanaerobaculia bacterium]|jgi:tRNA threonylcarbamoyladenosine modification (KEOPS) complex  Pcc1 subunit|nr:trimeric autotransporter adhesin [Thermoanaerobaculia bacterium]